MIGTINAHIDEYLSWLKERTQLREVNVWVEITTPFLDRHNDCLQIYVRRDGGFIKLTDGGAIIQDLELCGCDLSTEKRQAALMSVLQGFGLKKEEDGSLSTTAGSGDFAMRKHRLVQAMLSVDDMFFTASPIVRTFFAEDVALWLNGKGVRYTPSVKFTGKSGYDHAFDFVIPRSRKYPERILQSINNPNKSAAELFAFKWMDTFEARHVQSLPYVVLNDEGGGVPPNLLDAFRNYGIKTVLWSSREEVEDELAA